MNSAIVPGSVPLALGFTSAIASNTAASRRCTSEWLPADAKNGPQRLASEDRKVVQARLQDSSMLQFTALPVQPVNCTLKPETQPRT